MNKIRLWIFFTAAILVLIGVTRMSLIIRQGNDELIYSSVLLIIIGGMLVLAVRKK